MVRPHAADRSRSGSRSRVSRPRLPRTRTFAHSSRAAPQVRPLQEAGAGVDPGCGWAEGAECFVLPRTEDLTRHAQNAGVEVTLAKADATLASNKELSERFGVRGYPTLKMFVGHSADAPRDYAGPREADGIVTYLTKQSGPASVELKSAAEAEALVASEDVLVVGIFPSGAPSETFMATAQRLRDEYTFAHVSSASLLPGGAAADPATTVVVFKSFDDPSVAATTVDVTDADTLSAWIAHTALPLVAKLDKEPKNRAAMRRVFEFKAPKGLVFAKYDGAVELQLSAALTAGAKAHPELKFVVGDATDNDGALQFFGFTAEDLPAAVIHDTTDGAGDKKYARAKLVLGELDGWLQDFKAGKLSPTIKSEPLPTPNDGPVTILVAKNFADIVVPSKTILLEFYAPWCAPASPRSPARAPPRSRAAPQVWPLQDPGPDLRQGWRALCGQRKRGHRKDGRYRQ